MNVSLWGRDINIMRKTNLITGKVFAMNKRGQLTIFIILGILIAAVIAYLLVFDRKPSVTRGQDFDNPESYIDNCVKEKTLEVLDEMILHGGFVAPNDTAMYDGNAVAYLCKNVNYYQPCITQHPRYLFGLQREFAEQVGDDVVQCFAELEQELTRRNYAVDGGDISINAEFKPEIVELKVFRDFTISKGDFARSFDSFDIYVPHPIYDLAFIANEIVAQEARWCYFSNDGFMALYTDYDIRRDVLGDSTKIYSVKHKETGDVLMMAIRGCAIPAGF